MRSLPLLAGALLGLVAAPLRAQDAAPPIDYETFTLDNGLTVIVHEDHSTPVVAVTVWYDVGSAHEEEGRSGFAHLFEHMLSQETEKGALLSVPTLAPFTANSTRSAPALQSTDDPRGDSLVETKRAANG